MFANYVLVHSKCHPCCVLHSSILCNNAPIKNMSYMFIADNTVHPSLLTGSTKIVVYDELQ